MLGYEKTTFWIVMRAMFVLKGCLLLCVVLLCSCNVVKAPLKPQLMHDVRSIEVAEIEVDSVLLIRRVNPIFFIMGSSGLVADALVVGSNASRYEAAAGPVHEMCVDLFKARLMESLSQQGMYVHSSGKRYWDYFKPSQKQFMQEVDALLHIRLKQMGFWSKAAGDGYFPSVLVDVELIDPVSRDVLYSDQFSMGIDFTSVEVMALTAGKINMLPVGAGFSAYENFKALLENPIKSRDDLFEVMGFAADYIAQGLRRPKTPAILVFEPSFIHSMPDIPSSFHLDAYDYK